MVNYPDQGDLISVKDVPYRLLVVSSRFFNDSGSVVACPVIKDASDGPLHIADETPSDSGRVICEQMKYFNLKQRSFRITGRISFYQLMDISDAIQGIFEYI